jgi:uncharacterized protein YlaI
MAKILTNIKIHKLADIENIKDKDVKVYNYFKIFIKEKPITNLNTEIFFIEINNKVIPCTLNNEEYDSTYINSLYAAFILYSREEIKKTKNIFLIYGFKLISIFFSFIFKVIKINKVIQINNWLLSTNIVVELEDIEIEKIKEKLLKEYPKHVYLMRSVTEKLNFNTYNNLKKHKFDFMPTRKVYLYDKENKKKNNNIKNDIRLKNKTDFKLRKINCSEDFSEEDFKKIEILYNNLYIDKHSKYNPQYNYLFIKNLVENNLIELYVYEKNNIIEAVGGMFSDKNLLTLPIVGYNTEINQKEGLYRLIILEVLLNIESQNKNLNLSSGVGEFKELRGGKGNNEYAAIYLKHIPFYKRFFWKILIKMLNVGLKIVEKYKL